MLVDDIINQRQTPQDASAPPKRRRWFRWLFFLAVLVIGVGFCVFSVVVYSVRSKPPYSKAIELIQSDAQLIEHIGEPIRDLRWLPTSGYPEQFQMQVQGPSGVADISVRAGEFEGQWQLMAVDVFVRESSKRFSLDTGSGAGDAPTWTPSAPGTEASGDSDIGLEPPAGIDIELPGEGPPGVNIELPEPSPDLNIQMPEIPPAPES
jgi:hypothetical protein